MKLYFAKYLSDNKPCKQSDLKQGDMILWKDEIHKYHSDQGYGMKTYTSFNEETGSSLIVNWSNWKGKVKLFLISRDIQVGDTSFNNQGAEIPWMQEMEELYQQGSLLKEGLYKVIGEISTEAIWVTEGMEFEEDEWLPMAAVYGGWIELDKEKQPYTFPYRIEIKGQCGHFH